MAYCEPTTAPMNANPEKPTKQIRMSAPNAIKLEQSDLFVYLHSIYAINDANRVRQSVIQ